MLTEAGEWALILLHASFAAAWTLAVFIWNDKSVWFLSGGLGSFYMAAMAVFMGRAVRRAQHELVARLGHKRDVGVPFIDTRVAVGVITASLLALLSVVVYTTLLAFAVTSPASAQSTEATRLALDLWSTNERPLGILVFTMLAATATLLFANVIIYARALKN